MRRLVAFWLAFWTALGLFFYLMDRRGLALCRATRYVFRTDTTPGRVVLFVAGQGGALVLLRHLLKHPVDSAIRSFDRMHS